MDFFMQKNAELQQIKQCIKRDKILKKQRQNRQKKQNVLLQKAIKEQKKRQRQIENGYKVHEEEWLKLLLTSSNPKPHLSQRQESSEYTTSLPAVSTKEKRHLSDELIKHICREGLQPIPPPQTNETIQHKRMEMGLEDFNKLAPHPVNSSKLHKQQQNNFRNLRNKRRRGKPSANRNKIHENIKETDRLIANYKLAADAALKKRSFLLSLIKVTK